MSLGFKRLKHVSWHVFTRAGLCARYSEWTALKMEAAVCCEISVRLYHNELGLAPDGSAGGQVVVMQDVWRWYHGLWGVCGGFVGFIVSERAGGRVFGLFTASYRYLSVAELCVHNTEIRNVRILNVCTCMHVRIYTYIFSRTPHNEIISLL